MKTKTHAKTLNADLLRKLNACWRAANYLSGEWLDRVHVPGRRAYGWL